MRFSRRVGLQSHATPVPLAEATLEKTPSESRTCMDLSEAESGWRGDSHFGEFGNEMNGSREAEVGMTAGTQSMMPRI